MSRRDNAGRGPRAGRRQGTRPVARRSVARPAARAGHHRRQITLTARAAILAVALAAVAVAVALPMKIWLGQRSQISSLSAQTSAAQRSVRSLQAQQKQWNDPAYVEAQARQRLHYVMPGQKTYVVLGDPSSTTSGTAAHTQSSPSSSWYSQLWSSVQDAGKE